MTTATTTTTAETTTATRRIDKNRRPTAEYSLHIERLAALERLVIPRPGHDGEELNTFVASSGRLNRARCFIGPVVTSLPLSIRAVMCSSRLVRLVFFNFAYFHAAAVHVRCALATKEARHTPSRFETGRTNPRLFSTRRDFPTGREFVILDGRNQNVPIPRLG